MSLPNQQLLSFLIDIALVQAAEFSSGKLFLAQGLAPYAERLVMALALDVVRGPCRPYSG